MLTPPFSLHFVFLSHSLSSSLSLFNPQVIRYESIIHEFDPWFNFRATEFLTKNGYYALWNWFDSESWYPIGRYVAGSLYPGLMTTSWAFFWGLIRIGIPVNIRDVCVFIAPTFAAFSAIAAYNMTREITKRTDAGLFSALFVAVVPSYMSRSVAGSYDNEAVAIFALIFSIYGFLRAINTGRLSDGCFAAFALFYLIASWGGYAFVINLIPIFVLSMFIIGKLDTKIFVGYNVLYVLTTLWAMLVRTTGFNVLNSSEHLASHGIFIFLMAYYFVLWIKSHISKAAFETISKLILSLVVFFLVSGIMYIGFMGITKWSGRSMTLLDPTYAKNFIPIIASVSEHQATTWSSFFFDLHFLIVFTPVGLFVCLKKSTPTKLFISLYLVLSVYFASVMVRLLLVLAPAVSVLAGIGVSALVRMLVKGFQAFFMETVYPSQETPAPSKEKPKKRRSLSPEIVVAGLFLIIFLSSIYVFHGTWSGSEAYASPSVVMAHKDRNGNKIIVDDYREAYYWLRKNTAQDAKVMSWWDYGYQIAGMGNRTTIVDNNTWNFTHIAIVGLAMASPEEEAYEIAKKLDVDYVLIIFGAISYYSGDDINKFLWMVRISGGVFPHIKEEDYYGRGQVTSSHFDSSMSLSNS